jgi:hypothetical protein
MRPFGKMDSGSKGEGIIDRERPFGYISFGLPRESIILGDPRNTS